jgi:aryl-phospho-beta-D-glucosidase BglC (GH1 family)
MPHASLIKTSSSCRFLFNSTTLLCLLLIFPDVPLSATGWHTSGVQIDNPSGAPFVISGVNWYGFETTSSVAHGLYHEDYTFILNEAKQYGYSTIRIPFSNQMWESDPIPNSNTISACPSCKGTHSRDILGLIINYAGSIGLHVILDNHRSEAGNSNEANGLWYVSGKSTNYPESSWISDWVHVIDWVHGIQQTQGSTDTVTVNYLASDGFPIVIGYDLRNEPHTVCTRTGCNYVGGSTWGTGDGIDPTLNPNPNPFAPTCVSTSTCHDWRLAAERAGDDILGEAASRGWDNPIIFVEGTSQYPVATGTPANGPYDFYWQGGEFLGVNGNTGNAGAPIVLNAGGNASSLGSAINCQLVYSAHDYGPTVFVQPWFTTNTCYVKGCSPNSLADLWANHWGFINLGQVNPVWPGHSSYPWSNTGSTAYTSAPVWIGEFGTGNATSDVNSAGAGSQGQWFTDLVNFINSSFTPSSANDSGYPVQTLHWTYWSLNGEDSFALLNSGYNGLALPAKEYSFLCFEQQGPFALVHGTGSGQCGSTGVLPPPQ